MKLKLLLAASLTVALSAPALAADEGKGQDAPKEKKICRTETVTGSLVAKRRICMTKAEWDKLALDTKHNIDKFTSRGSGIPGDRTGPF